MLYQPPSDHLPPEAATVLQRTEQMGLHLSGLIGTAHEGETWQRSSVTAGAEGPCAAVTWSTEDLGGVRSILS